MPPMAPDHRQEAGAGGDERGETDAVGQRSLEMISPAAAQIHAVAARQVREVEPEIGFELLEVQNRIGTAD